MNFTWILGERFFREQANPGVIGVHEMKSLSNGNAVVEASRIMATSGSPGNWREAATKYRVINAKAIFSTGTLYR
jgi:hypothetical protein